ncbi:MAG: hypothetical protein R3F13_19450 [Prosthecobacter sp.]
MSTTTGQPKANKTLVATARSSRSHERSLALAVATAITLALMKPKTKRAIASCATVLVVIVISGAVWISMPFVKNRDLDSRYATVSRGMSRSDVINAMNRPDYRSHDGSNAWWDDEPLGAEADARVSNAISYTVKTFILPVTFEFTFDEAGKLVGRHRYD